MGEKQHDPFKILEIIIKTNACPKKKIMKADNLEKTWTLSIG